jgi:outer membrane protein TolC
MLAQQELLETELELIEAYKQSHLNRIALYKALGGGWR